MSSIVFGMHEFYLTTFFENSHRKKSPQTAPLNEKLNYEESFLSSYWQITLILYYYHRDNKTRTEA